MNYKVGDRLLCKENNKHYIINKIAVDINTDDSEFIYYFENVANVIQHSDMSKMFYTKNEERKQKLKIIKIKMDMELEIGDKLCCKNDKFGPYTEGNFYEIVGIDKDQVLLTQENFDLIFIKSDVKKSNFSFATINEKNGHTYLWDIFDSKIC